MLPAIIGFLMIYVAVAIGLLMTDELDLENRRHVQILTLWPWLLFWFLFKSVFITYPKLLKFAIFGKKEKEVE